MEFTDLIALKVKELMKENEISIYKLESLTGIYTSTISQFLTRKTKTICLCKWGWHFKCCIIWYDSKGMKR